MKRFVQVVILLIFSCGSSYAGYLEILYVNSNVGAAAGGHVGLKLGNDVFHYQFYPDDRFLLVREPWVAFQLVYNRLRNRTIYGAECSIPDEALTRIREHFNAALASQRRDFFRYHVLLAQKEMLAGLRSGFIDLSVRGLGFFNAGKKESAGGQILRTRISEVLGETYLQEKKEAVTARLERAIAEVDEGGCRGDELLEKISEISDLKKQQAAYETLVDGTNLLGSALVSGADEKLPQEDLNHLERSLNRRLQVLAHLLVSGRRDSGEAVLVEAARCHALLESLTAEKLLTLDPYPEEALPKELAPEDPELQNYLNELFRQLSRKRSLLLENQAIEGGAERDYHYLQLENVNGRLAEIGRAIEEGAGVRVSQDMMVPGKVRTLRIAVPGLKGEAAGSAIASIDSELSLLGQYLDEKYRYALIDHNCVTELLRNLNGSFPGKSETVESLGGWIDLVSDRVAIPYNFFYQVSARYRVSQVTRYPSRRIMRIEAMEAQSSPAAVWFSEGNTVSSSLYRNRTEDTPFLFFTDDLVWPRPILGLSNLLWSAVHGLAGIIRLPVEGAGPVRQAARGMFYSLPELVFFNIRKGTYLYDAIHEGGHEL